MQKLQKEVVTQAGSNTNSAYSARQKFQDPLKVKHRPFKLLKSRLISELALSMCEASKL